MKKVWKKTADCFRAEMDPELPAGANVLYTCANNMSPLRGGSVFFHAGAGDGDYASDDLVIVGDSERNEYVLAGAVGCRRSFSYFTVRRRNNRTESIGVEQPDLPSDGEPEKLLVLRGSDWRKLLIEYAETAAAEMGAPKIRAEKNLCGYCTWYYDYGKISDSLFLENVRAIRKTPGRYARGVAQIDSGYQRTHGDWLTLKEGWGRSLEETAREVASLGMTPGIWLAPLIATTFSELFRAHPDWFVLDSNGKAKIHAGWDPPPHDQWLCLDGSNPEVHDFLRETFQTLRRFGYRYFKLDALGYGLARGTRKDPAATPVSAFRAMMRTIREAVPDAWLLACSSPFLPVVGLVDSCRIGCDTGMSWDLDAEIPQNSDRHPGRPGVRNAWHDAIANWWMNDRWFRCDPDCVMARRTHTALTEGESRISVLGALWTGIAFTSDHFGELSEKELRLLNLAADFRIRNFLPLDWSPDSWPHVFGGTDERGCPVLAFVNDCDCPISFRTAPYGMESGTEILIGLGRCTSVTLPPHDAALLIGDPKGRSR